MRQFRLRTALIAIAALAVPLSWLGAWWRYQALVAEADRADSIAARWHPAKVHLGPRDPAKVRPRFDGDIPKR